MGGNKGLIGWQRVVVRHTFDQGGGYLAGHRLGMAGASAGKLLFHSGIKELHPAVLMRGGAGQGQMRRH